MTRLLLNKAILLLFIVLFLNERITNGLVNPKLQHHFFRKTSSSRIQATVSLTDDGGVTKNLITPGKGRAIEAGDILAIEYTARVKGTEKPFARADQEKLIAKDGSMIKGWDLALGSMTIGEKAVYSCSSPYAYGSKGVGSIIPANSDIEIEMRVLAWLGNQLRPESLFQKDLDVDPFIASTPESIRAEYEDMQAKKNDKYEGNIVQIYWRRLTNISFGFGGSGFFTSQSGEKAPWYLNPNLTFPAMITVVLAAFVIVFQFGGVKEKGQSKMDLELATIQQMTTSTADKLFS
jgi:hypothetical protein